MNLDDIIEDLPSKKTPLFKATFEKMCNAILDKVYPIGRGFIDFTNTDYSNYLGFTWERELVNLTPIGCDAKGSNIGTTKGSETHKHYGALYDCKISGNWVLGTSNSLSNFKSVNQSISNFFGARLTESGNSSDDNSYNSYSTDAESSYQPSKVVAYWKRVA